MLDFLNASWKDLLASEFKKPYFEQLQTYVEAEYSHFKCYPPKNEIFTAFNSCSFEDLKVVILGQDPYHGPNQANGLCFSVQDGMAFPPSLINIFKELESDLGIPIPIWGNLERWASQGVLLLNATLTVRQSEAGSHQNKGWETFTDAVIQVISSQKEGVVFLLWGGYAQRKGKQIDRSKHLVLTTGHPSPLSANRGFWFGNQHFSKTNEYLIHQGKRPIEW
jgi:uracil-DNA glycosylase